MLEWAAARDLHARVFVDGRIITSPDTPAALEHLRRYEEPGVSVVESPADWLRDGGEEPTKLVIVDHPDDIRRLARGGADGLRRAALRYPQPAALRRDRRSRRHEVLSPQLPVRAVGDRAGARPRLRRRGQRHRHAPLRRARGRGGGHDRRGPRGRRRSRARRRRGRCRRLRREAAWKDPRCPSCPRSRSSRKTWPRSQ